MPTIDAIAFTAINILVTFLGKAMDAGALKMGESIYELIRLKFKKITSAKEKLNELKNTPDDKDIQVVLRAQLKKLLEKDDDFKTELSDNLIEFFHSNADPQFTKQIAGDYAMLFGAVSNSQVNAQNNQIIADVKVGDNAHIGGNVEAVINYTPEEKRTKKTKL